MSGPAFALLASGRGSNADSLLAACAAGSIRATPRLVLCNVPGAGVLDVASRHGVEAIVIDHRPFGSDRPGFEAAMQVVLERRGIELVCLAGFMRVLTADLVHRWRGRLVNIHPSLLPSFPGLHTHRRALAAGAKIHGCTVHHVVADVDAGPIIGQAAVPVLPDDDEASLGARVLAAEHRLYPAALSALLGQADGRSAGASEMLLNC